MCCPHVRLVPPVGLKIMHSLVRCVLSNFVSDFKISLCRPCVLQLFERRKHHFQLHWFFKALFTPVDVRKEHTCSLTKASGNSCYLRPSLCHHQQQQTRCANETPTITDFRKFIHAPAFARFHLQNTHA